MTQVQLPSDDPRAEYAQRLEAWKTTQTRYDRQHRNLGIANLTLGVGTLVLIGLALVAKFISVFWVLAPLSAIVILATIHGRILKRRERSLRTAAYYQQALARIDHRWMGTGKTGERFQSASHPYSRDLDLLGAGSLFELLCAARTWVGEETLAQWLLAAAAPDEVRARQQAVLDLRGRVDLRERVAVLAEEAQSVAPADALAAWGEREPLLASMLLRFICAALAGVWLFSLAAWVVWGVAYPALLVSAINISLNLVYRRRVGMAVQGVEIAARDLGLLAEVLARIEAEPFAAPRLVRLRAALDSRGRPPSRWIALLHRLLERLDSRRNMIVGTIDLFVFWTLQCACAIETWRKHTGAAVRGWLAAVGEFEALSSLGGYAYEHPADVFPEFVRNLPCFEAQGLAHPLLPDADAVRNDLCLGTDLRTLIISGPNMAGKSTFVRAVGINAVLAQCGAPVRARRLLLSPLAVGASI